MYKTIIFIALCIVVASCDKVAKPTTSKEELLLIDTLQLAHLELSLETQLSTEVQDLNSEQDLVIKIEQGNFKSLSQHYYGSTSYATLLKHYNNYKTTDTLDASTDALRIPLFENLVYFPEQKASKKKRRTTEKLVTVYEKYHAMERELRALPKSNEGMVHVPNELRKRLYQLSDQVAVVYSDLQLEPERSHEKIGALKSLSSHLVRMAQDSLQINDKSVDIVHHRLAAAFVPVNK